MLSKGMVWAVFSGLFIITALGVFHLWNWVAYGHLAVPKSSVAANLKLPVPEVQAAEPVVEVEAPLPPATETVVRKPEPQVKVVATKVAPQPPRSAVARVSRPHIRTAAQKKATEVKKPAPIKVVITTHTPSPPRSIVVRQEPVVEGSKTPTPVAKAAPVDARRDQTGTAVVVPTIVDQEREAERLAEEDRRAFREARERRLREERRRRRGFHF